MNSSTDIATHLRPKWSAKLNEQSQKIQIQANHQVTYIGQLSLISGMNVQKLINKIQKGQIDLITKTTSKMQIQIGCIPVNLYSAQTLQIMQLKAKVIDLQAQLKQLKTHGQWEHQDLNSKTNFDLKYIYQIHVTQYGGCSILNTWTFYDKLTFSHGATLHTISASNKKVSNHGYAIIKILKRQF